LRFYQTASFKDRKFSRRGKLARFQYENSRCGYFFRKGNNRCCAAGQRLLTLSDGGLQMNKGDDRRGNFLDVLTVSLKLGLTSFGGPIAHLGYFERVYVKQKRWLNHEEFSSLTALCQILPGPTSSQVNFLIGLKRAGWEGALLSWVGFTLPSACLMFAFAIAAPHLQGSMADAFLHGLQLVAVPVVAQAVASMAGKLCPDRTRAGIAIAALVALLLTGGAIAQIFALILGGVAGFWLCRDITETTGKQSQPVSRRIATIAAGLFFALLAGLPVLATLMPLGVMPLVDAFYRSGALVFGGGHVVLPLLHDALAPSKMVLDSSFLSGYGAAQAMPGPLFTLAAYLGAAAAPSGFAAAWSAIALFFIFLPGMLAAIAGASVWSWLRGHKPAQRVIAGVNAAVVGILGAAFFTPVCESAIRSRTDIAIAVAGYFLLERWKMPPLVIVLLCVVSAMVAEFFK
jgi:chromate transporter